MGKKVKKLSENPEHLFRKAIYLKPSLLLKGREKEVYNLLKDNSEGLTAPEIAAHVEVSPNQVHQIIRRLMDKTLIIKMPKYGSKTFRYLVITPDLDLELNLVS